MFLSKISIGPNPPEEVHVLIENPLGGVPVKYEIDKESGAMFVDRFLHTAMYYPGNYGFIPHTLSGDGDPVDVLVVTPYPLQAGVVITCRAVGILKMEDEAGIDGKVLAVPVDRISSMYSRWKKIEDVNTMRLEAITHFFQHYKDLEPGKWVKVLGWEGPEAAHKEVTDGLASYRKAHPQR